MKNFITLFVSIAMGFMIGTAAVNGLIKNEIVDCSAALDIGSMDGNVAGQRSVVTAD